MKPRPHQSAAIGFAIDALSKGPVRCLAQMPTGSGKGLVKLHVAQDMISRGRKVVLLSPSSATISKLYLDAKELSILPEIVRHSRLRPVPLWG
jgi:superfamily II DNA or RNA helicase